MYKRQGLDCSNGSAFSIAKNVFDALGAKTYVINNEPDGTNINLNCGSTHIEVLQEYVAVSYTHLKWDNHGALGGGAGGLWDTDSFSHG